MKSNTFIDMGCFSALGNEYIWVDNHPYASFTRYNRNIPFQTWNPSRPSRLTIVRARRKYREDILSNEDKRNIKLKKLGI